MKSSGCRREPASIAGEGGVEAVCFADTRGSQVEIVQNIDRPLRHNREGAATTARTLVPVFLRPGETLVVWGEWQDADDCLPPASLGSVVGCEHVAEARTSPMSVGSPP